MKHVITTLSIPEFQETLRPVVREEIASVLEKMNFGDEYMGQKSICETLNISPQTAIAWAKKGILKPIKIESKVYYLKSDIDQLMKDYK